jgi:beta-lactamase class A
MSLPTAAAPTEVRLAHCLLDADGTVLSAEHAEEPFYAASTIKLHVLLAVLRAAEAGHLDLEAELPVTCTFTGADGQPFTLAGDHLDPTHPAPGTPLAARELAVRMIDRSSNEATDQLLELVGLDAVADVVRELGLAATRVERRIGDAAALAQGLTNETSAADLARTMHALITGTSPQSVRVLPSSSPSRRSARSGSRSSPPPCARACPGARSPAGSTATGTTSPSSATPRGAASRILAVMTAGLAPQAADARITDAGAGTDCPSSVPRRLGAVDAFIRGISQRSDGGAAVRDLPVEEGCR